MRFDRPGARHHSRRRLPGIRQGNDILKPDCHLKSVRLLQNETH